MNNIENSFIEVLNIIEKSKESAMRKVNEELIFMYWNVGKYISDKSKTVEFGDAFINSMAQSIQKAFPGIKGFNRRGLYRMKQFYETYANHEFVSPLVTQISWSNNLLILSGTKSIEEKEFYICLSIKENYSKRELERQLNSAYYERYMLSKEKLLPESTIGMHTNPFLDTYVMEFLDLPEQYKEVDFRKALVNSMKNFILELGKDFTFVGQEYRVQVGNDDFYIDLLFFQRELSCLVAFELKIGKFKPEYISKMDFYLEALDRQNKKKHENPSVGIILCASKNDEIVEYAMSRSMSQMMVAEYTTKLPNKQMLQEKLKELSVLLEPDEEF